MQRPRLTKKRMESLRTAMGFLQADLATAETDEGGWSSDTLQELNEAIDYLSELSRWHRKKYGS